MHFLGFLQVVLGDLSTGDILYQVQAESARAVTSKLVGVELMADSLDLGKNTQCILAEDFPDVRLRVALLQQRIGDLRNMRHVLHSYGHYCPIEIGPETDMIGAGNFHGVINVLDDEIPIDFREFARLHELSDYLV